MVKLFETVCY